MFNLFRRRQSWHIVVPSLELDDVCDRILWYMYQNRSWCSYVDIFSAAFQNQTSAMFNLPFKDAIAKLKNEDLIVEQSPYFAEINDKGIRMIAEIPFKYQQRPFHYSKKIKRKERRYERFKEGLIFGNAIVTLALAGWQGWDSYQDKPKKTLTAVPATSTTAATKTNIDTSTKHKTIIKK